MHFAQATRFFKNFFRYFSKNLLTIEKIYGIIKVQEGQSKSEDKKENKKEESKKQKHLSR